MALREFMKYRARLKCQKEFETFYKCAQKHPIAVAFKCADIYKNLNDCLSPWTSDQQFDKILNAYIDGLIEIPIEMFDRPEDSKPYR